MADADLFPQPEPPGAEPPQGGAVEESDPANRSLADALKVSFAILRLILLALVVVFVFSGSFKVKEGEVAVRLHLGKPESTTERKVYAPGGPYFAWPEPLDQVIRVPVVQRDLVLDRSFWFALKEGEELKSVEELPARTAPLDPEKDGSLLTADKSLLHGKWVITWQVTSDGAPDFVQNVSASADSKRMLDEAERVLRCAAEQAVMRAVALHTVDQVLRGDVDWNSMARIPLQRTLDALQAGITVNKVGLLQQTPPLAVREAYRGVNEAESEKTRKIVEAETARTKILGEAAGETHPVALAAIAWYERAQLGGDPEKVRRIEQALDAFLDGGRADACFTKLVEAETDPLSRAALQPLLAPREISGKARALVEQARADGTRWLQTLQGEAATFKKRLEEYEANPRVIRDRLWRDTLNEIYSGGAERFYLPPGQKEIYLDLSRDPKIRKEREREAYEQQEKEARERTQKK